MRLVTVLSWEIEAEDESKEAFEDRAKGIAEMFYPVIKPSCEAIGASFKSLQVDLVELEGDKREGSYKL